MINEMEDNKTLSPFDKEIVINNAIKGRILDINEQGVLMDAQADFLPGATLDLKFVINGQEIKAKAPLR